MSDRQSESARYFAALALVFDMAKPLRWNFVIGGVVPVRQVDPLLGQLTKLGFPDVDAGIDESQTDDEPESKNVLFWCSEICVHASESLCQRVIQVNNWAEQRGLKMLNFHADEVAQVL